MNVKLRCGITGPTLIIEYPTNILYCNQTGGCSCNQREIQGFIFPYNLYGKENHPFFNPNWWYKQYGYNKDNLYDLLGFSVDLEKTYSMKELDLKLRIGSANGIDDNLREWKYWTKFVRFIEKCYRDINLKISDSLRVEEAWIPCTVNFNDIIYNAILTWSNCD